MNIWYIVQEIQADRSPRWHCHLAARWGTKKKSFTLSETEPSRGGHRTLVITRTCIIHDKASRAWSSAMGAVTAGSSTHARTFSFCDLSVFGNYPREATDLLSLIFCFVFTISFSITYFSRTRAGTQTHTQTHTHITGELWNVCSWINLRVRYKGWIP